MTHLKSHACEGPFVTLFQRDLLLAFEAVDSDVCEVSSEPVLFAACKELAFATLYAFCLAQPIFGNLSKIIIAAMKEK